MTRFGVRLLTTYKLLNNNNMDIILLLKRISYLMQIFFSLWKHFITERKAKSLKVISDHFPFLPNEKMKREKSFIYEN